MKELNVRNYQCMNLIIICNGFWTRTNMKLIGSFYRNVNFGNNKWNQIFVCSGNIVNNGNE